MRRLQFLFFLTFVSHVFSAGVDPEQNAITVSLGTEPPSLDSSLSEDGVSGFVLAAVNEGLVRLDRRRRIAPGVAEKWEVTDTHATFWLRANARWSDGSPVTAQDFVYAWRRLVDPKTGASGSTFFAYVLENGKSILAGDKPVQSLGVEAVDDKTLKVTLSGPIPYLLDVLLGSAYYPLKKEFVEAQQGKYGAEADRILFNGPFMLKSWQHGASLELVANPFYWNKEKISLKSMKVGYITSDTRALLNLFLSDEIATLNLDEATLKDAGNYGLKMRKHMTTCVTMLTLNIRKQRPTSNKNLRKALQAVFDREIYVNRVIGIPANQPAYSVFTQHLRGVSSSFQKEYPAQKPILSRERALQYMKLAAQELGHIPPLTLLSAEGVEKRSEYLQGLFGEALGLEVRIDKQTFKQAIVKLIAGDFDIAQSAFCAGSLRDPAYFAGIFDSEGTFNDGRFASEEYDQLLNLTRTTTDQQKRMNAFGRMQQILFEQVAVLPTHENGQVYVQDPRLTNLVRWPVADFTRGRINLN